MSIEQTLVIVKPDGVERGLIGKIVGRIERKGLRIRALRMLRMDEQLVRRHYAEHLEKPFFPDLKAFVMRSPVVAMVVAGERAVEVVRSMMGATKYFEAAPGTIRGDHAFSVTENLVHGSDSPESAAREVALFFSADQIVG